MSSGVRARQSELSSAAGNQGQRLIVAFASGGPAEGVRVAHNLAAEADSLAELRAHAAFAFGYINLSIKNDAVHAQDT